MLNRADEAHAAFTAALQALPLGDPLRAEAATMLATFLAQRAERLLAAERFEEALVFTYFNSWQVCRGGSRAVGGARACGASTGGRAAAAPAPRRGAAPRTVLGLTDRSGMARPVLRWPRETSCEAVANEWKEHCDAPKFAQSMAPTVVAVVTALALLAAVSLGAGYLPDEIEIRAPFKA